MARTLIRNTSWLFVSDVIGNILSFFLVILIARFLGDSGLGIYSYAISFVSLIFFLLDTGTLYYVTKESAKNLGKLEIYMANLLTLRCCFCFLAFLIPSILIFVIQDDAQISLVVLLTAVAMFFNYFGWSFRPVFQVCEKLKFEAISRILERSVAFILGIILLAFLKAEILAFIFVFIASYLIFYASRVMFAKRFIQIRFAFNPVIIKEIFIKSLPFWATLIFLKLYLTINTLMLSWMTNDYAIVGWYSAASKFLEGLSFIPAIIGIVLFPVVSKLFVRNKKRLQLLLDFSFKYFLILVIPITVGVLFLADKIIILFYTNQFVNSIPVLQILILAALFGFLGQFFGNFLQATNRQYHYAVIVGLCAAINVILNIFLIPSLFHIGAALSTLIVEIVGISLFCCLMLKTGFKLPFIQIVLPIVFAGFVMGFFLFFLRPYHLFLLVPTGAAIFFALLFMFRVFRIDDWNLLREAIKK